MDKNQLSERDICTKFITPAILQAGWQQHQFREDPDIFIDLIGAAQSGLTLWSTKEK